VSIKNKNKNINIKSGLHKPNVNKKNSALKSIPSPINNEKMSLINYIKKKK